MPRSIQMMYPLEKRERTAALLLPDPPMELMAQSWAEALVFGESYQWLVAWSEDVGSILKARSSVDFTFRNPSINVRCAHLRVKSAEGSNFKGVRFKLIRRAALEEVEHFHLFQRLRYDAYIKAGNHLVEETQ